MGPVFYMTEFAFVLLFIVFIWLFMLQDKISSLQFQIKQLKKNQKPNSEANKKETINQAAQASTPKEIVKPIPQTVAPITTKPVQQKEKAPFPVVKLFSWIGGFTLLLGIIFLAKYSLEHNLISPTLRIIVGILLGMILWGIGANIKKKEQVATAHTLLGCGIGTCYITVFCAYYFYQMFTLPIASILLGIITLISFATSVWKNAKYIGVLSQIIGFLTPFILSATNSVLLCLIYILFIALASVTTAIKKGWDHQFIIALVLSTLCQSALISENVSSINLYSFHLFLVSFEVLFLGAAFITKKGWMFFATVLANIFLQFALTDENTSSLTFITVCSVITCLLPLSLTLGFYKKIIDEKWAWIATCLASITTCITLYCTLDFQTLGKGFIACIFACTYAIITYWMYTRNPSTEKNQNLRLAFLANLTTIFATLAIALQFSHQWLTIALALEGMLCIAINRYLNVVALNWIARMIFSSVAIRLLLNPFVFDYYTYTNKFFNWYLYTYGICASAMLLGAWLWKEKGENKICKYLQFLGGLTLFWLLNIQIANYFTSGHILSFDIFHDFSLTATYTIVWILIGAVCALLNIKTKNYVCISGLVLIGLALLKLFVLDIWILKLEIRILVLICVSIILILLPFIYQKYKHLLDK